MTRHLPLLLCLLVPFATPARANVSGFSSTGFTLNQGQTTNGLSVANNVATLTDGKASEGNSIFYNTKQGIGAFQVAFTYQDVGGGGADGFTFTLQNDTRGAAAVGGTGNSLGYAGPGGTTTNTAVTPSVAIGFNIYGTASTGLSATGALTLGNTGIAYLSSGDLVNVTLTYNGTTLTETLTDASTKATNTFTYNSTNSATQFTALSALGSTAYVGFTGATGASSATQQISNFSFTTVPEPATWAAGGLTVLAGAAVLRRRLGRV